MSLVEFTVTRNTQKNVINSEGFLENVGNNVPGFEYKRELIVVFDDPESDSDEIEEVFTYRGALIEPASTNLFLYSENFSNNNWVKNAAAIDYSIGTSGIQSNVAVSPNGSITADRVNFINQSNNDVGLLEIISSGVSGDTFVASFFVKGEGNNIGKNITIKIKRHSGGSFVGQTKTFTLTDKWQRVGVNLTLTAGNIGTQTIISSDINGATSCLLWGAQLEKSSESSSYIKTEGSIATRNADIIRLLNADQYTPNEGQVVLEWEQYESDTLHIGLVSGSVEPGVRKLKFIYTSTEQKLYIDDVLVDSITGNYDWSGMDKIELGNFNGSDQPTTHLRLFAINENTV